ncbi:hypothetical protein LTR36_006989 [Oleoguttula mirabilis]|uniref:Topoisomerase 1-associated factor 1 n=1 Tax=Oleoguttula mirabilis TaxID=1507867 RepID=A0AAV9JAJ1_9PEZI|nr:hypothetical protein LTR36_006989 [Oleoguttula mirabilis]
MEDAWEKPQTVDVEVRAYISSLCNAVGGTSTYDDTYAVGDDALAALNDLLRWLRLYDEKLNRFDVKRCLAEANLVKGDLLEILALWPEEATDNKLKAKLALACLQLLVPLTWPPELENETATANHHRHLPYLQLAQVGYKRAVLHYEHAKILRTAVRIGLPPMAQPRRERTKRDEGIVRLVLYLLRNMAMITQPQMLPSQGDENEISRSSTISVFAEQDVFNLLLTIGSGANEEFQDQDVILLEILFHLLKGVDAKKLFMQKEEVQQEEGEELRQLMLKEKAMRNGYNKHAPTRHNRFGTMIWVKRDDMKMSTVSGQQSIADESTTLHQMDSSKKWNKPRHRGKLTQEFNEQTDFGMRVDLPESSRKQLRSFVEDFLDSSFNPLFSSLRKAIERETERVQEMHKRQYFYLIHWFLDAECARRDQARRESLWHADRPTQTNPEDNTFAYIAAVLDQETFVLLNRHMQRAFDEKNWQDLQATLLCFTQILLTTQSMTESKDEEDQEIAENILNRIFYEEATHDRIVSVLRGYTNQGFAYLDAVTECVHVFVRMLERYSKQNADLQIRSKHRARKKAKQQTQGGNADAQDDADEAAEDEREVHAAVSERKFDFARFSAKFLSQPCVDTYLTLLHYYADLTPSQLKRCHRYLYRLAFKHELAVFLFRVDILQLLHRMVKGPEGLGAEIEGFRDWETLVQQVFRRCVKWLEKSSEGEGWKEMCVVEMLFSKIPNTVFYLQNGYERVTEKRAPRAPAELDFKVGVGEEQRIPVVVSLLLEQGKGDVIAWLKNELERAYEERQGWQDERDARDSGHGEYTGPASQEAPAIFLSPDNEERKQALFKDKHLRLLLTSIGLQRLGTTEDVDTSWIVPTEIEAGQLQSAMQKVKDTEFDPPTFEDGKAAADLVRNKPAARRSAATFDDDDSADDASGSGGDIDEAMFPPNLRDKNSAERPVKRRRLTKRNRGKELTDAEINERTAARQRKEKERNSKIKSQLYVTASDDESDDERDAEFFRKEEERRAKIAGIHISAALDEVEHGAAADADAKKGRRRKSAGKAKQPIAKRKRKAAASDGEDSTLSGEEAERSPVIEGGLEDSDATDSDMEPRVPKRPIVVSSSEDEDDDDRDKDEVDEDEDEGTPSTSPAVADKPKTAAGGMVDSDDEDDVPIAKPMARRSVRAGFIIDSDSE